LGVDPAVGRVFRPEDEIGDARVVVLSHGFWTRQFAADPSVVGRAITLSDQQFQVVGVMPQGFAFPETNVEAWAPFTVIPATSVPLQLRGVRVMNVVGRLAPGATPAQARADLTAIAEALSREHAETNQRLQAANAIPLQEALVGNVRRALLVLFGAVAFVLLIACVNVANLLLARGIGRRRELAVRAAAGAARARIVRMLLAESLVLALLGAAVGCALAFWGVDLFLARSAGVIPRVHEVAPDAGVLAFAVVTALIATIAFGLFPAVATARSDPARHLREGGGDRGATRLRARGGLVAAEVAIAMVLLVGAGLLIRSFWTLSNVDPGFKTDRALALSLIIPSSRYLERERYLAAHDQILERLRAIPGVEAVGSIRNLPMRGAGENVLWQVADEPVRPFAERPIADIIQVTPDLFRALGVPLLRGRSIDETDRTGSPLSVVVNQTLARQAFGGADPVGREIRLYDDVATVVGVVGDIHQRALETPPAATVYVSLHQIPRRAMTFVLRTGGDPLALAGAATAAVRDVDPRQAITEVTSLDAVVHGSVARPRFFTLLLGGFAALAIALAVVGIYAVLAFAVQQRTREIGIRMALGADRLGTLRLVLRQGMTPVLAGVAAGIVAATVLTRVLRGILFEVRPFDPATYGVAALSVAVVTLIACWIPSYRATRVPPLEALRYE
jgi:predicted permease